MIVTLDNFQPLHWIMSAGRSCVLVIQEQTVRELELRVKHQSVEVEKGSALRQKVSQEKAQLELQIASLSAELQEAKRR